MAGHRKLRSFEACESRICLSTVGLIEVPSPALVPGDADGNGLINFDDFLQLAANFGRVTEAGSPAFAQGDFDGNEAVDLNDFLALAENFGRVAGDADGDGTTDFDDFLTVANNMGLVDAAYEDGDFNGDQIVDELDARIVADFYGIAQPNLPTPSPAIQQIRDLDIGRWHTSRTSRFD